MRTVDIVGVLAFMAAGLAGVRWAHQLAKGLLTLWAARSAEDRALLYPVALLLVLVIPVAAVVLGGLVLLEVAVPRPGPYPGGVAVKIIGGTAVAAVIPLFLWQLHRAAGAWRVARRAHRSPSE